MSYLPYDGNIKAYKYTLLHLGDDLEVGEHYAVIAYDEAATVCLDACIKPHHHMVALIAYYPTQVPSAKTTYPHQLHMLIHLASSQRFGTPHPNYVYSDTEPGFAEADLDEYDKVAADLSWSRTLTTIRRGFRIDVDLEPLWDEYIGLEFGRKDTAAAMSTMAAEPFVNHVPTLTGGIGQRELFRFYQDYFIAQSPPMKIKLVSRTIGTDRLVDEMIISFRHTRKMDWLASPLFNYCSIADFTGSCPTCRQRISLSRLPWYVLWRSEVANSTGRASTGTRQACLSR